MKKRKTQTVEMGKPDSTSFSITCKPGRLSMRKRHPTKRQFSFNIQRIAKPCCELFVGKDDVSFENSGSQQKQSNAGNVENVEFSQKKCVLLFSCNDNTKESTHKSLENSKKESVTRKVSVLKALNKQSSIISRKYVDIVTPFLPERKKPVVRKLINIFSYASPDIVSVKPNDSVHICQNINASKVSCKTDKKGKDEDMSKVMMPEISVEYQCSSSTPSVETEDLSSDILLISPVCNVNKSENSSLEASNQCYSSKNLSNYNKRHNLSGKTVELNNVLLKPMCHSNIFSKNFESKCQNTEVKTTDSLLVKKVPVAQIYQNTLPLKCSEQRRFPISEVLLKQVKRLKMSRNFTFEISESCPNLAFEQKKRRVYIKKKHAKCSSEIGATQLNRVEALMLRNSLLKRKITDVTDLEIAFAIISKNLDNIRMKANNPEVLAMLKCYERKVMKHTMCLISKTVGLQITNQKINKVYKEMQRKGKYLGTLIDNQLKIRRQMVDEI